MDRNPRCLPNFRRVKLLGFKATSVLPTWVLLLALDFYNFNLTFSFTFTLNYWTLNNNDNILIY